MTSLAFALREVFRREGGTSNRLKMKHFGLSLEKAYNALPLLLMFLGQAFYIPHSVMIFLLPYLKLEELK